LYVPVGEATFLLTFSLCITLHIEGVTMKGLTERPVDKSCLSLIKQDIACQIKDVIQFAD